MVDAMADRDRRGRLLSPEWSAEREWGVVNSVASSPGRTETHVHTATYCTKRITHSFLTAWLCRGTTITSISDFCGGSPPRCGYRANSFLAKRRQTMAYRFARQNDGRSVDLRTS